MTRCLSAQIRSTRIPDARRFLRHAMAPLITIICLTAGLQLTACQNPQPGYLGSHPLSTHDPLVFLGRLELPNLIRNREYWLEDGPMIISPGQPLLTFRVMRQEEFLYAGSGKTPASFIASALSTPTHPAEAAFGASLSGYTHQAIHRNDLQFHVLQGETDLIVYITSSTLDIALEFRSKPGDYTILNTLIEEAKLRPKD